MRTSLYNIHIESNAKVIDFHGWDMPVYYTSIKEESQAVRNYAGIFDVSHMGNIFISGTESEKFIDYLITNSISDKPDNKIVYSPICNENGGIVDDILVYKISKTEFLLIVNASNKDKDLNWIVKNSKNFDVTIDDKSNEYSLIAVQGQQSGNILNIFFDFDIEGMKYYTFQKTKFQNIDVILSRTGYTGDKGFEILVENKFSNKVWNEIISTDESIKPCGLGARDVLRIEAGFPLYGQELSDTINPFDANLDRFVKMNKKDFIGKKPLTFLKENHKNIRIGFIMSINKIARENCEIYTEDNKEKIGWVSSGTFSFLLNKSIGMGFIDKKYFDLKNISIKIGDRFYNAKIVPLPFLKLRV